MANIYTQGLLTIIALALSVLVIKEVMYPAQAQIGYARVQICDERNCLELVPFPVQVQGGRSGTMWALPVTRTN
jgi:hypothetical protein